MLVIGSVALQRALLRRGVSLGRRLKDLDVICTREEMCRYAVKNNLTLNMLAEYKWQGRSSDAVVEFELLNHSASGHEYTVYSIDHMSNSEASAFCFHGDSFPIIYAPLEVLYSIKKAHRHYPRMWKKHAEDRALMQTLLPAWPNDDALERITKIREKETEEREGRLKTPSLNKAADDFFNDKVSNKTFVHDDIHAIMAHREKPMFEYIKKDSAKVACSREKFEALPLIDRYRCVLEEAYVIALERHIIPMLFAGGPPKTAEDAFNWALMRISTNLCSGWFREFAVMNYNPIMHVCNPQYVELFLQALQEGRIKKIVKEDYVQKES